jgi:hypothetical protein
VLSLDLPTSDRALINAPTTTPLSLPALLTGGSIPSAMGVVVEDGVIKLTGGSASVNGTLNADGMGSQSGGNVIAYADNHLSFGGTIAAKGGELGGNGGFVDTSGKGTIAISPNAKVVTTAVKGLTGTWLIDPADLEVVATGGNGTSTIGADTIVTSLNTTNVNLQADNSITVNATIDVSANANAGNLTLTAPTANLNQAIVLKDGSTLNGTATTVNVGATGTVQNGVDVAATGGTVNLAAATYTLAQEVGISKNVIVRGAGAGNTIVSGNNAVRVFKIGNTGNVTLDGMSIVNGKTIGSAGDGSNKGGNGEGGGIYNVGSLNVSNSTLSGNSSNGGDGLGNFGGLGLGGGIYNFGRLTVNNSNLSNNSANGGINSVLSNSGGGGAIYNAGTFTVSSSIISGNTASFGGGIHNTGTIMNTGIGRVSNSTLSNNSADTGGGISNSNTATLTIDNSTLSNNSARNTSGIHNDGGQLMVNNSTLSNNIAQIYGGGILNFYGTVTVNNSTFSANSAQYGGGISNINGTVTVNNSTLSGNLAQEGGGIYTIVGAVSIGSSIVSGNTAPKGSEIYSVLTPGLSTTSQGYNLFGHSNDNGLVGVTVATTDITPTVALNQIIGALANNGGPTQTHGIILGSPAIGTGNPTVTTPDQRGEARVGITDIGAFESKFIPSPIIPLPIPIIPIESTPQPVESIQPPIVGEDSQNGNRTRNLESSDPRQPLPSVSNSKALLCVVRALKDNIQRNDPYKGIETCAPETPEIEGNDRNPQADAPRSVKADR